MRTAFLLLPAALSALVLGAHFLRRGQLFAVLLCLALVALLFTRRAWCARVVQGALLLGAIEWMRTIAETVPQRVAAGEPWLRMAMILGAVALVALVGALLFQTTRLRERYGLNAGASGS